MKIVFKIFLVLLVSFLLNNAVYAEKMQVYPYKEMFNPRDNPIAYRYFESYAKQLYEAFDTKKLWMLPLSYGVEATYILHKDGTVSDIVPGWNDKRIPRSYKYGMSIIQKNLPKPFPKNLEEEGVRIDVFFCKYNFDRITMDYYSENIPIKGPVRISITKNHKIKNHQTPTPKPPFGRSLPQ